MIDYVNNKVFTEDINYFGEINGNYLRFNPTPKGKKSSGIFDKVPKGHLYRSSTIFSVWKKSILLSVLKNGESAWDFEIKGSPRTDIFEEWFSRKSTLINYVNLVIKGKVDPRALNKLIDAGIPYFSNRDALSEWELTARKLREFRSSIFNLLPKKIAGFVRRLMKSS